MKKKKFQFGFYGRQTGAIGITYKINEEYEAYSLGEALYMLWTDYESIRLFSVYEGSRVISVEEAKNTELIKVDGYTIKANRK